MRVVHLNQDPGIAPGRAKGAAIHVEAMRESLDRLGCEVLALDVPHAARARATLDREHALGRLDLVYERYALGARAGADFTRETGVPLVLEVNAPLLWEAEVHRGRPATEAERRLEAEVLGAARLVLAVSTQVADYAAAAGVPRERILVRPNGFDPRIFYPRDSSRLRRRLGIDPGALVLGFHGRLRPWHGFQNVVQAFERLLASGRAAHLLLVGAGDWRAHLEAPGVAASHTLIDWVPHDEVGDYVACFDVLALGYPADAPCYFSPLKLLEAMAAGAVPVVPDLGDLGALVRHRENGLIYPAGDVPGLAAALAGLIDEPLERNRLGAAASATAEGRTWDAVARDVLRAGARSAAR